MFVVPTPRSALNKVPEVTLTFWLIKVLSTTVGETIADYLAVNIGWGTAVTDSVMAGLLVVALYFQVAKRNYVPWIYWITVVLVSIVGTQITDLLTDKLDVSLYASTGVFGVLLFVIFVAWFRSEGTLSISAIDTRRRELFYWLAILCTFALGTAAGDLATEALGMGFKVGSMIFSLAIAASALAYLVGMNSVAVFWVAYILTRPLGASLGDLLSQSKEYGGFGLGAATTSAVFLAIIMVLVAYLTAREIRRPQVLKRLSN
jgi:uncharacterized membrane-anchored protein